MLLGRGVQLEQVLKLQLSKEYFYNCSLSRWVLMGYSDDFMMFIPYPRGVGGVLFCPVLLFFCFALNF